MFLKLVKTAFVAKIISKLFTKNSECHLSFLQRTSVSIVNNEDRNRLNLSLYSLNILFKLHFVLVVTFVKIEKWKKSSKENPLFLGKNLHINSFSFFSVTKEHKSSTKIVLRCRSYGLESKQTHTKLNPFVWFKSFFLSFFHLVRLTKGLNALMSQHTKDYNDVKRKL